jgi:hypothetical protein
MKYLMVVLLLAAVCCSKSVKQEEEEEGTRQADPKYQAVVTQFAEAVAQKDYPTAYNLTSPNLRSGLTYNEFVETWQPYIDSFDGEIELGYVASDDPQEMSEFVPEADRAKLVEEVTIELSGMIEDTEETFFCTTWVIDDGGAISIGSFYVED